MFTTQLVDSSMQFSGTSFFFSRFTPTFQVVVGSQTFRFDLRREVFQGPQQQIDGWLACRWAEQFPCLLFQVRQDSLGTDGTAKPTAKQRRLQAFVLQALFALAQLIQTESKDRFEQAAIGVPDQPLEASLIQP